MPVTDTLVLKFEPSTIEHLGVKMYSHIPPALAELIANAYDACATHVHVKLYNSPEKKIVIEDNGIGMSFNEINDYFLRIGRNRRKEKQVNPCGRKPTGKKGLGKLALFGLGDKVEIETIQANEKVTFSLHYSEILSSTNSEYTPKFKRSPSDQNSGTIISLKSLKHKSDFSAQHYAKSLANLFNFPEKDFNLFISLDDTAPIRINNKMKFEELSAEFEWKEDVFKTVLSDYQYKDKISGIIITTAKPIKPALRGVTLFANGRMVNAPEFFGKSESSHFFSYLTGYLNVDFLDDWEDDVISTNRQSIDWELQRSIDLKEYLISLLSYLEADWREKRKNKRDQNIQDSTGINIEVWKKTLPKYINDQVGVVLQNVTNSELETEDQSKLVKAIYNIAPQYPLLHWRQLHPEIQSAAEADYKKEDFYRAFIEAVKRYITTVRSVSNSQQASDQSMMAAEFGFQKALQVAAAYNKPNGDPFHQDTYKCIEDGQKYLSMGIVSGARNPISHEEISDLRDSGLFTEKDCLDMLSLLSHLFYRLTPNSS